MSVVFAEPCYIKATHRAVYRAGEWAEVAGVKLANMRPCYLVMFNNGKTDLWPVVDPNAGYEFSAKAIEGAAMTASRFWTDPGPQSSKATARQDDFDASFPEPAGVAQAEPDGLREAARYRWLRNFAREGEWEHFWSLESEALDEAIDRALSQQAAKE